ncbi:hypothetical protein IFM89_021231 [Coptis chinensis]|uniref:F-box domain-containing protein n=1 Tax=Coptis chinensis TaxID=261450 RepID=A0A835LNC1_9MAGN|nr:hypothetical protein IFM89_021231 [Coptis chinensis]
MYMDTMEESNKSQWSNLPLDVLAKISTRLVYADHVRLRAVCKQWHSLYGVQPLKQSPWLITFDKDSWSSCELFDPVYKTTFIINISSELLKGKRMRDINVHSCKDGWLLLSQRNNKIGTSLFLFSPFTNGRTIVLPYLESTFQFATFSSTPTDSGCVFFVLNLESDGSTICMKTCYGNDRVWNSHTFKCDPPLVKEKFVSAGYLDGTFYCATNSGTMGTYNIARQRWDLFQRPEPVDMCSQQHLYGQRTTLVQSDKDILLAFLNHTPDRGYTIYKFDRLNMIWNSIPPPDNHVFLINDWRIVKFAGEISGKFIYGIYRSVHVIFGTGKVILCTTDLADAMWILAGTLSKYVRSLYHLRLRFAYLASRPCSKENLLTLSNFGASKFRITICLNVYGIALLYTSKTLAAVTANTIPVITFLMAVLLRKGGRRYYGGNPAATEFLDKTCCNIFVMLYLSLLVPEAFCSCLARWSRQLMFSLVLIRFQFRWDLTSTPINRCKDLQYGPQNKRQELSETEIGKGITEMLPRHIGGPPTFLNPFQMVPQRSPDRALDKCRYKNMPQSKNEKS